MAPESTLKPLGALMASLAFFSNSALSNDTAATSVQTESASLPTVEVETVREAPGYLATKTRVGKVLQDPHDVPQAVTTVTNNIMQEQQVGSLREAMRNVSGVSFNAAEGGRSGDNMNLRGFYTFGDMYLDGIRDTAQYNRETFNLEQIDVLRGAGAMLFGRGQAGGVINQVSKTPLEYDQYKLTGSAGSYGYAQQTVDMNKSINDDTGLRVNLMNRDEGSWRSNPATGTQPEVHRQGLGLSMSFNQQSNNRFWLNHYYLNTRDNPDYGISFDGTTRAPSNRLSANAFYGINKTFDNSETNITSLTNELRLSDDSQLRTQLRVANYQRSYWAIAPSDTLDPSAIAPTGGRNKTRASDYQTVTLQSDFSKKFHAYGMKHEVLAGIEYLNEDSYRNALKVLGGPSYTPYLEASAGESTNNSNKFTGNSYAIYAQDTIEFIPKWKATAGLRRDQLDATYNTMRVSTATTSNVKYSEWSTRAALSFHPSEYTHHYLAFSDSFSPTADLYQLATSKPAERSNIIELGTKWLLMDGDLALRAALYRATKDWERNADLESTSSILTKKRRTDGMELEAAGRITNNWEVFSGLALMNARILEVAENATGNATPTLNGERARNTPRYTFNLWTTYKLNGGWKIGGGIEAKGDRLAYNPASTSAITPGTVNRLNTAPAYERVDALVSYEQKSYTFRLNIKNVLNRLYYDAIYDNGGFTVPGVRRTFILTGEFKF